MDTVWKALEAVGNLMLGVGTLFVGLAAFIKAARPQRHHKRRKRK